MTSRDHPPASRRTVVQATCAAAMSADNWERCRLYSEFISKFSAISKNPKVQLDLSYPCCSYHIFSDSSVNLTRAANLTVYSDSSVYLTHAAPLAFLTAQY